MPQLRRWPVGWNNEGVMRLNLFLPFPERSKKRTIARRILRRIGVTWFYSPARRLSQMVCVILFLFLFFYVCWPYGSREYARAFQAKEVLEAEIFLALDPLLSISTALAARVWIWSLSVAGAILLIGVVFPRGFCGYICPLGTLMDIFDWAIGRRKKRSKVKHNGWWSYLKYYILLGTLVAAVFGVLLSGFVAAIPVVTRGMLFLFAPWQTGLLKGWYRVPPMNAEHYVSLALFLGVFCPGFLTPRFWCRYVCPTGDVFSVVSPLRLTERKVRSSCIQCGKCADVCPFDAVKPDFTTRTANCTFCQTCGGACPTHSIELSVAGIRPI